MILKCILDKSVPSFFGFNLVRLSPSSELDSNRPALDRLAGIQSVAKAVEGVTQGIIVESSPK